MGSLNKAQIIGRLGRDPELRFSHGGSAVCNFTVATNHRAKQDGQWTEQTEWHRVVCFGAKAEAAGQYLKKGSQAYVEGRIQTREWEDREGNARKTTEIVAYDVQFLDSKQKQDQGGGSHGADEDIPF